MELWVLGGIKEEEEEEEEGGRLSQDEVETEV